MMENIQIKLEKAADGLWMMSESDYPFTYVSSTERLINQDVVLKIAEKPIGTSIEKTTLDYLLRNMTDVSKGSVPAEIAGRFKNLATVLKSELRDLVVYRVGVVQVDVFILGISPDGTVAGVRTKLIET